MTAVTRDQRHTRMNRCPICDGADGDPRGQGKRCSGFTNGEWCHCSREDHAGLLAANDAGLFGHRLHGSCKCGETHGATVSSIGSARGAIEATYDYRDENGILLFQVVRKTGKRFLQRKPDGAGGWDWKVGGVRRVLFHLPELIAADRERIVYVVEGEKDVLRLDGQHGSGTVVWEFATCNPAGAGKWKYVAQHAQEVLAGRDVVVVADRDEINPKTGRRAGEDHAREVAASLTGVARSVRVVQTLPPHKDVSDLLNAGGNLSDLVPLVFDTPENLECSNDEANSSDASDWTKDLIVDRRIDGRTGRVKKTIRPTSANVATILTHHPDWRGVVALDLLSGRVMITKAPPWSDVDAPAVVKLGGWGDADTARTTHWFARTMIEDMQPITISTKTVDTALLVVAERNPVHPVREYLRSLQWDGVPRVEALASKYLGGEDTPYSRAVGACFLKGAVARVMKPGCKVDMCPIFEGPQGQMKSTAIEVLGGQWFTDSKIMIGTKDGYQALRGAWIVELGELAALSKSDVETTKAFISARVDRYRPSYGHHEVEVPRQNVFVGTTNSSSYLQDTTGARRFPPLRIGAIDIEALRRDRDQLWAEAVHRFDAGETWWFAGELVEHAAAEAEQRFVQHPWESTIVAYLANPQRQMNGVTSEDLLTVCGVETGQRTVAHSMTVGGILSRLGWEKRRMRVGAGREYRYFVKGVDS